MQIGTILWDAKMLVKSGVVLYNLNPNTWKTEARWLLGQGQPVLHSKNLGQKICLAWWHHLPGIHSTHVEVMVKIFPK